MKIIAMKVSAKMFGKRVFAVTGPGDCPRPGSASSEGMIISDSQDRWGDWWIVLWTDGESAGLQEPISKHSLRPNTNMHGIGVYYEAETGV